MYNILELNEKELTELKVIAKELGIRKIDSFAKEDLVYKILDRQAILNSTEKATTKKAEKNDERGIFSRA